MFTPDPTRPLPGNRTDPVPPTNNPPPSIAADTAPSPAQTTQRVTPTNTSTADIERWRSLLYNSCLGIVIAGPIIALMPPRKLDLFTFGLGVSWCYSAGYCVEEKTGKGLLWHLGSRIPSEGNRRRIKEAEEEERRKEGEGDETLGGGIGEGGLAQRVGVEQQRLKEEQQQQKGRGLLRSVWMGGESDDWVQERARKEKEALEEGGKGYGGLMMDQMREAFGYKAEGAEEDDKGDEKKGG